MGINADGHTQNTEAIDIKSGREAGFGLLKIVSEVVNPEKVNLV